MASMQLLSSRLLALVKYGQWSENEVTDLFVALTKQCKHMADLEFITQMSKTLYQIEIHKISKSDLMSENEPRTFVENIQEKVNTVSETKEKTLEEILDEIKKEGNIEKRILDDVKEIVSYVDSWCRSNPRPLPTITQEQWKDEKNKSMVLCKLCEAVKKKEKWYPRLTQMVSWCILVLSGSSRLVQVGTGEGKSCIVAMFAAHCAIIGERVDIISSSPVLAERDARHWRSFYQELKVTVDANSNKKGEEDLRKCYACQVVYGTTQNFAGDWLRHNFHRQNVRPNRKFQRVIVDEVDSLMLDKGLEVVYLNNEMPVMQALTIILAEIWFVVNQLEHLDTGKTLGLIQPFSQLLSENLGPDTDLDELGILQMAEDSGLTPIGSTQQIRENAKNILQQFEGVSADQTVAFFNVFNKIFPQCKFKLFLQEGNGTLQELNGNHGAEATSSEEVHILVLRSGMCRLVFMDKETLHKSLEKRIKTGISSGVQADQEESCIPGFMKHVNSKLHTWIENALLAKSMTLGDEYILHDGGVVPVDYRSTGVVQNNMKWGDGLQQFLEMKHQTRLTDMCVITNFKSNVSLFKSYKDQIYGVTGTLGNQTELDMLQKLYPGMTTCKIPSFKKRKLYEKTGVIIAEENEWIQRICAEVHEQVRPTVYRGQRAALVICETINRAETIYQALQEKVSTEKLKRYTNNNMDNSSVTDKKVEEGCVIIATNLAGRGTDLKICDDVNKAGGLFVVQTFLPLNIRVEQQAFGRTARQGSPGSAQLIMCSSHFSESLQFLMVIQSSPLSMLLRCLDHVTSTLFISASVENEFKVAFKAYRENPDNLTCEAMAHALRDLLIIQDPVGPTTLEIAKQARDSVVKIRLSGFLDEDIPKILKKEELFSDYLHMLETRIYNQHLSANDCEDIVSSLHECWGMWLLMKFNEDEPTESLRQRLRKDLASAVEKLKSKQSPSSMVYYHIRSGNRLRHQGLFAESIEMYTKAIEKDCCWEAIALYNRAISILKKRDPGYIAQALVDLEKAGRVVESYMQQLEHIFTFVRISSEGPTRDDLLTAQFQVKYLVQELLKDNIEEAVKTLRIASNKGRNVQVTVKHVLFLMPVVFVLSQFSVREMMKELVNLHSLGLDNIVSLDTTFSLAGMLTKLFTK